MKNILKAGLCAAFVGAFLVAAPLASAQQAPSCSPSTQLANIGDFVSFSASGGNSTYYWLAANGTPNSGSGRSFGTRFNIPGDRIVVLTSNGQNSLCVVRVTGGQVLGVSDVSTGPEDVAVWALAAGLLGTFIAYPAVSMKLRRRG